MDRIYSDTHFKTHFLCSLLATHIHLSLVSFRWEDIVKSVAVKTDSILDVLFAARDHVVNVEPGNDTHSL